MNYKLILKSYNNINYLILKNKSSYFLVLLLIHIFKKLDCFNK